MQNANIGKLHSVSSRRYLAPINLSFQWTYLGKGRLISTVIPFFQFYDQFYLMYAKYINNF